MELAKPGTGCCASCWWGARNASWDQTEARENFCEVCGERAMCDVFAVEYPEEQTGYVDEGAICAECRPGMRSAPMGAHSQEPHYIAMNTCSRPNRTDKAIEFLNQEKGEYPQ